MDARSSSLPWTQAARRALPLAAGSLGMALLIAASARIGFLTPLSPVPVTLQVAAVLLAGFLLGPRWGVCSVAQYVGMGLMGAPVFAMGLAGPAVVLEPSFGYILGFFPAAWIVGKLSQSLPRGFIRGMLIGVLGVVVIYLGGVLWLAGMAIVGGASPQQAAGATWASGIAPFLLVDFLKVVLCAGTWAMLPSVTRRRGWRRSNEGIRTHSPLD